MSLLVHVHHGGVQGGPRVSVPPPRAVPGARTPISVLTRHGLLPHAVGSPSRSQVWRQHCRRTLVGRTSSSSPSLCASSSDNPSSLCASSSDNHSSPTLLPPSPCSIVSSIIIIIIVHSSAVFHTFSSFASYFVRTPSFFPCRSSRPSTRANVARICRRTSDPSSAATPPRACALEPALARSVPGRWQLGNEHAKRFLDRRCIERGPYRCMDRMIRCESTPPTRRLDYIRHLLWSVCRQEQEMVFTPPPAAR